MFTQLIGSRPSHDRSSAGTSVSLLVHAAVLATVIVATSQTPALYEAPLGSRVVEITAPSSPRAEPVAAQPRAPERPQPVVPKVEPAPIAAPSVVPSQLPAPLEGVTELVPASSAETTPTGGTPTGTLSASDNAGTALGASEVDRPASLRASSPLPQYPEALRAQRLEGGVHVRLVVGTDGRVEMPSVSILESTHPAFAAAVRAVLPRLRFTPARVGRTAVRQVVVIPFGFELTR